jgi:predicted nucleic acid-binding Zn ribbon protein
VRGRRKSEPVALGKMVHRMLGELGLDAASDLVRVADHWADFVGAEAARHSRPTALRGRVLEATVDSSAWCQDLQLRRPRILAALRQELGDDAPTDLWLRVG